ncbi:N-acetyl-1-D-myo-inositol-2-amino-2-deoxy-alpha-D-glucopyranoside deacetylase [Nonomuraea longicatena]
MTDRRLLLVHAHPDDETINTGATMARYAAQGAHVTLVTCTLGEEGEVIPSELAHLEGGPGLGPHRMGELAASLEILGVADHRYLGGAGRFRDSGMMGSPSNEHPEAFWRAPVDTAAALLAEVIDEVRPQVLVTYDDFGYYGHPDHIQAHRVAVRAVELASWQVAKFYLVATAESVMRRATEGLRASGTFTAEDLTFGTPDADITTEIDGRAWLGAKLDAMRAQPTQLTVREPYFALSSGIGQVVSGVEHFVLHRGERGRAVPGVPVEDGGLGEPYTRENDLFAGID